MEETSVDDIVERKEEGGGADLEQFHTDEEALRVWIVPYGHTHNESSGVDCKVIFHEVSVQRQMYHVLFLSNLQLAPNGKYAPHQCLCLITCANVATLQMANNDPAIIASGTFGL